MCSFYFISHLKGSSLLRNKRSTDYSEDKFTSTRQFNLNFTGYNVNIVVVRTQIIKIYVREIFGF